MGRGGGEEGVGNGRDGKRKKDVDVIGNGGVANV